MRFERNYIRSDDVSPLPRTIVYSERENDSPQSVDVTFGGQTRQNGHLYLPFPSSTIVPTLEHLRCKQNRMGARSGYDTRHGYFPAMWKMRRLCRYFATCPRAEYFRLKYPSARFCPASFEFHEFSMRDKRGIRFPQHTHAYILRKSLHIISIKREIFLCSFEFVFRFTCRILFCLRMGYVYVAALISCIDICVRSHKYRLFLLNQNRREQKSQHI